MNERIKNLVKQTARELVYEHDDEIGGVMDVWKFQNKDIEKFAELIVRECGIVADQWVNDEDNGQNLVSAKLKQHFGVEE